MSRILATAKSEFRIALRNRWVAIAVAIMALFAAVLSAVGTAPSGALGVDRLSATVASLTSLSVYLVPLVALLMSFDAVAGEVERGTLPLLLTYPIGRGEILLGKLLAHLGVLAIAVCTGYSIAALTAIVQDPASVAGLGALVRLIWSSIVLGAAFLGMGYALSALAKRSSGAAGLAIGLWLVAVVLYDIALLAAIVVDGGGVFTVKVFPVLMMVNPADAFRIYNLTAAGAISAAAGIGGAASAIPAWQSALALCVWPLISLFAARFAFRKVMP
jgi:Cu-processing system permease protein